MPTTVNMNAQEILKAERWISPQVISVDYDSILFLTPPRCPHTAWLHHNHVILVQDGFVADAPPGLHARA